MNIKNTISQNRSFTARNPEIRFADNLARKVNKEYPRISSSLIGSYEKSYKFSGLLHRLRININTMRYLQENDFNEAPTVIERVKAITDSIRFSAMGNCAEASELTLVASKLSGIKDVHLASLYSSTGDSLDHQVLYVKNGKKPYIIDTWLGFADYVPNAITKYKNEFSKYLSYGSSSNKMVFMPESYKIGNFLEKVFDHLSGNKEIRSYYDNLIIKKGSN